MSNAIQLTPSEFLSKAMVADTIAVDTETNGKDIRDGRGFAIGISAAVRVDNIYYSAYFPVAHETGNVEEETKNLLFQIIATRPRVVMHNAKFDLDSLETAGFNLQIIKWYCTMMMAHFLNENVPKGLDWLSKYELKEPGKNKPPEWVAFHTLYGWSPRFPANIMALYACEDAVLCLKLFFRLEPFFKEWGFDGSEV
ncbi:hypothetical protein ACFY7C_36695 [Streptomyces sp. NPDC012769]|uniref:hypothetical protein n=1 Tax=Streptomyces sp. NPDC012769 TaxID=3364848 RepID=UPI0036A9EF62